MITIRVTLEKGEEIGVPIVKNMNIGNPKRGTIPESMWKGGSTEKCLETDREKEDREKKA